MDTRQDLLSFVAERTLAMVGMSRAPHSFSASAARELRARGYRVLPVNPHATAIDGEKCYPSLAALPEKVGGALLVTPPAATEQAVRDAVAAGIDHLWIQQGAESSGALAFCRERNLRAVSRQCILMFAEPVRGFHRLHRWCNKLLGRWPR
ncbi:MAG TPA: CoA-binding protein [Anaeromyxobacteraceae bacterium]|nr:CoA-binding protein [Anaeromyxobacteraceae bacterium]